MGQISYSTAVLGQGQTDSGAITCVVNASDTFGATEMATFDGVRVLPQKNQTALVKSAAGLLQAAYKQQDGSGVAQVLSALTSSINSVNCSVPVPCAKVRYGY